MNNPETIATYRTQKTQDEDKQNIKVEKPEGTFKNRNNPETTSKKTNKNKNKKNQKQDKAKQNTTQKTIQSNTDPAKNGGEPSALEG